MNYESRSGGVSSDLPPSNSVFRLTLVAVCVTAIVIFCVRSSAAQVRQYLHVEDLLDSPVSQREIEWLKERKEAQLKTWPRFNVFHDFRFTDRLPESGITFQNRVVDDAARDYKAVHYDHGNGLAVADVDEDGLVDIYFVNQIGDNELWRNLGGGQFQDITQAAGVALSERIGVAASFADIDNDGDQDLYVTTVKMGNVMFENVGRGRFKDITRQAGLSHTGHSSGAVFFDYDRDGLLDLFLTNVGVYTINKTGAGGYYIGVDDGFSGHLYPERAEQSILYRNLDGKRFADVSRRVQLEDRSWSGDASFVDLNSDLWPDLYVLNMQGNDHYYENVEGQRFVEKTDSFFRKTPWGAMGIKFFDYNNDGLFDLIVTDMHSDMSDDIGYDLPIREKLKSIMQWEESYLVGHEKSVWGNAFYRNEGQGMLSEVSNAIGAENYWPWGVSVDDLNADGFADVFITASMNYPYRYGINSVLLNNRGQGFLDSEFILGVEPRRDGKTIKPWFELDCSGADRKHMACTELSGSLTVMGALGSRGSVIFDLDGDGDLDIVTNEFNSEPQVLVSNLAEAKDIRFLKIDLQGTRSNRDGLGARVTVRTTDGRQLTRAQDGKSGYLSQSDLPLYFGLSGMEVKQIEILWPSGYDQTVTEGIELNRVIKVVEETAESAESF